MSGILKTRRVLKKRKYQVFEERIVKNPLYDIKYHREHGEYYEEPEYIESEIPVTKLETWSHIEYQIKCEHCESKGWVKRKDAKYCTASCRKLAYLERKKAKAKEAKQDTNEV